MQITTKNDDASPSPPPDSHLSPDGMHHKDVVRLFLQSLFDMGYDNAAIQLEQDSGITLETPKVAEFRQVVLMGQWSKCEAMLPQLCLEDQPEVLQQAKFLIRQHKFIELLQDRKLMKALSVLRNELSCLGNTDKLHELSSLMLCSSADEVMRRIHLDKSIADTRDQLLVHLQHCVDPAIMIPQNRLSTLIHHAYEWQKHQCAYHNDSKHFSLFSDHMCDRHELPTRTIAILSGHSDEVWHVAYSHSGRYLASASSDQTCIIWDMQTLQRMKRLHCPTDASFCGWSPDDSKIVVCGHGGMFITWDPFKGTLLQEFEGHTDDVACCVWLPDGRHLISGSRDNTIRLWNMDGEVVTQMKEERVVDMAFNGDQLIVITFQKKISVYNLQGLQFYKAFDIAEQYRMTSLRVSQDGRLALVNLEDQSIHLWDLSSQWLLRRYQGHEQRKFAIRSSFGGAQDTFIISGSEDHRVYIWSKDHGSLLAVLEGHDDTVNSIAWSPSNTMFASASDDHTIRIWGRAQKPMESLSSQ
ncbi:WD40 repeat-like protein [Hesseltinella vesiculosa]|uniref:WD40 repeat-like protein n=1 Tax=Hesseltinella vesiculosa TaxID=101127 RepID=A0A1X2GUV1_9FUNG|nr:WD40 repeat-like protein [Hesseltinella vesiculosa]